MGACCWRRSHRVVHVHQLRLLQHPAAPAEAARLPPSRRRRAAVGRRSGPHPGECCARGAAVLGAVMRTTTVNFSSGADVEGRTSCSGCCSRPCSSRASAADADESICARLAGMASAAMATSDAPELKESGSRAQWVVSISARASAARRARRTERGGGTRCRAGGNARRAPPAGRASRGPRQTHPSALPVHLAAPTRRAAANARGRKGQEPTISTCASSSRPSRGAGAPPRGSLES
jgi:hypothetical protein